MRNQCLDIGVSYLLNGKEIRSRSTEVVEHKSMFKWFVCRLFIVLFLNSSISTVLSQNNPYNEVSIVSPTAAALGKFGDIPVNNHTGIPQISLPIYTIKEGPLSLPIALSYHAGGLKVLETASWVGMGWALNAGGVISRSVNGAPDERLTSNVPDQYYGYLSDSGYHNYYWWPYSYAGYPSEAKPTDANFSYINDWKSF
jgi:hypothetical protein